MAKKNAKADSSNQPQKKPSVLPPRRNSVPPTEGMEQSFAAALKAVQNSPGSGAAWDHLEEFADSMQRPEEAAEAYKDALTPNLPVEFREKLFERALRFHEEWFGDNPDAMKDVLTRILAVDPTATWAFERLAVVLTAAEKWDDLWEIYDGIIQSTSDLETRKKLLDDAAQVAKDFANDLNRAVVYLGQLLEIDPNNETLASSTERLLVRLERWTGLVDFWRKRIEFSSSKNVKDRRLQIIDCCLDKLQDPRKALEETRVLLESNLGDKEGCAALERVLVFDNADQEIRMQSLDLLRANYDSAKDPLAAVTAVETAIGVVEPETRLPLFREAGMRHALLGNDEQAIAHYSSLLTNQPSDPDARKQLRHLSQRSHKQDLLAQALVAAGDSTNDTALKGSLLIEAAYLYWDSLENADKAIELFSQVLSLEDAEQTVLLTVAHNLNELLAKANRPEQQLVVLERLSGLERSAPVRKMLLGDSARLANKLGDPDNAIAFWHKRLEMDSGDLEALGELIDLMETNERWDELIGILRRRANAPVSQSQRRADLIRIARVQSEKLSQNDDAIDTWLEIREEFGPRPDTLKALDELFATTQRWSELSILLVNTASNEYQRAIALLVRLGDVYREHQGMNEQAAKHYAQALAIDPTYESARAGQRTLVFTEPVSPVATKSLAEAYLKTNDWQLFLEILEPLLATSESDRERAKLLTRAMEFQENNAEDLEAALESIARALPLSYNDKAIERDVLRLAELTNNWEVAAVALQSAALAENADPDRVADLRRTEGRIRETKLQDLSGAISAYQLVVEHDPKDITTLDAITRVSALSGAWDSAMTSTVAVTGLRQTFDPKLIQSLELAADQNGSWSELADAAASAMKEQKNLPTDLARKLEAQTAIWYRDKCRNLEAATIAAKRAVEYDPTHLESLQLLASLLRTSPGPELIDTLLRIESLSDRDLDPIHEASQVALNVLEDYNKQREIIVTLLHRAALLWKRSEKAKGENSAEVAAIWALNSIVRLDLSHGHKQPAVEMLKYGATLPVDDETACSFHLKAADLLSELGEFGQAIDLYSTVLQKTPESVTLMHRLQTLLEKQRRIPELILLYRRELEISEDQDRRLELRLAVAHHLGTIEGLDDRLEILKQNLNERPGHPESIQTVHTILSAQVRHLTLVDLLEEQAITLKNLGRPQESADLWNMAAKLAENPLNDPERAIANYTKVVELDSTIEALDSLARLCLEKNSPAEAATWLSKRLKDTEDPIEQVGVMLKLARAQLSAKQVDAGIATLETAFEAAPRNVEVRKLLIDKHRQKGNWEPLGRTLSKSIEHISDEATILCYAREAADIYHYRLGTPENAIPVLERALPLAEDDNKLQAMLAESLRASNRLDEAKEIAIHLLNNFGRRRSTERAAIHLLLAKISYDQEDMGEALEQLDFASKMDSQNVTIWKTLAELALEVEKLDVAERAYRSLLLVVRREKGRQDELPETDSIGASVILMELSRIATLQEKTEKADELLESAFEALAKNDSDAAGLQTKLLEWGENDLLERVFETRLANIEAPRHRANILSEYANLLEGPLDRPLEGLNNRLLALDCNPGSPPLHDWAYKSAQELEEIDKYIEKLVELFDTHRRDSDAQVRCELLLRLGNTMEFEREDMSKANEYYSMAEETGVREVDVWRARARVAAAVGDKEEQTRLLRCLATLGEGEAEVETQANALYRLAEIQLTQEETRAEGIEDLTSALEKDPRYARAGRILARACESISVDQTLLSIYERVARNSDDDEMLLDYLEKLAQQPDTLPEQIREAVELAVKLEQMDRAENLMKRAVEISQDLVDGMNRVPWALLGLAQRKLQTGDLAGAVKWIIDASDVAELDEVYPLAHEIRQKASEPGGDLTLATKLYENLLDHDLTARNSWEPLSEIYASLGDLDRLELLVDQVLSSLTNMDDRNALRLKQSKLLLGIDGREKEAIQVLQNILLDDPEHEDASGMLADYFEKKGDMDSLASLLKRQYDIAVERKAESAISVSALRLGSFLEEDDPMQAVELYRHAINYVPSDTRLLERLLENMNEGEGEVQKERAEIMERILENSEGARASELTVEIATIYEELEDEDGVIRVLALGYEKAPHNDAFRERLSELYENREDYAGLANHLLRIAEHQEHPRERISSYKEAVTLCREKLGDYRSASKILKRIINLDPYNNEIKIELAKTLATAGEFEEAIEILGAIIDSVDEDETLLEAYRVRGTIRESIAETEGALKDFEAAFAIDPGPVSADLEALLQGQCALARERNDSEMERSCTLRLAQVMMAQNNNEDATEILKSWVETHENDTEIMQELLDLYTKQKQWELIPELCLRLINLTEQEEQARVALILADASKKSNNPEKAREGLEAVYGMQPNNLDLRNELTEIYEILGAQKELASLLIEQAEATEEDEERALLLKRGGILLLSMDEIDEATPALEAALALLPADPETTVALTDVYNSRGSLEEASELLDAAISACRGQRSPDLCLLQQRKARLARAEGDIASELKWLRQAVLTDRNNGWVAVELADRAEELEEWDMAVWALKTIALMKNESPLPRSQVFIRQGRICLQRGDKRRALLFARQAEQEDPNSPEVATFIEGIGE